jgi:hypothetical protein
VRVVPREAGAAVLYATATAARTACRRRHSLRSAMQCLPCYATLQPRTSLHWAPAIHTRICHHNATANQAFKSQQQHTFFSSRSFRPESVERPLPPPSRGDTKPPANSACEGHARAHIIKSTLCGDWVQF